MADEKSWLRSRTAWWLTAILVPPLALVLLWWRRAGVWLKILGSLLLLVWSLSWSLIILVKLFDLRVEVAGDAMTPVFSFGTVEGDFEELQRQRAEQGPAAPRPPATPSEALAEGETTPAVSAAWPAYRGPAEGRTEKAITTEWPPPQLYNQPIGGGYASFAIADGLAFTIEQRGQQEVVVAYELRTGREVWTHGWDALFAESMGGDGPRATPSWHRGRIYALGAAGELRSLRAEDGELVWRRNILEDSGAENIQWGMTASPLVVDEMVIVLPGGDLHSVAAYDTADGELRWHVLSDRQAYTTPMEVVLAGQRQLLVVSAERAMGLELDGTLLWDFPWVTKYDVNAGQPLVIDERHFFISAGYGHGAALVGIGEQADGLATRSVWQSRVMRNRFSSAVLLSGHVYGLDEQVLACIEAATGERRWKGERYGNGQLLLAGGHLIVLTEKGELALVEAPPEKFVEVARFSAITGKTWNVPAIGEGVLLVRNARQMAAFDIASR